MHLICTRKHPAELHPVLGRMMRPRALAARRVRRGHGSGAGSAPRVRRAPPWSVTSHNTFQPDAPRTLHARPAPLHEPTGAHTSALHLQSCTTATHEPAFSAECRLLRPPHAQLQPARRQAPTRTDSRRISPPREAPHDCRRCRRAAAAAAELLGITPAMIAAADHTCENRT